MSNNTIPEYDASDERLPGEVIEQMRAEIARLRTQLATAQAECDRRAILAARLGRPWWTVAKVLGIMLDDEDWSVGLSEFDQMIQAVLGEGNRLLDRAKEANGDI